VESRTSSAAAGIILQSLLVQTGLEGVPARREAALVLGLVPPPSELHARLREVLLDENPRWWNRPC